MVVKGQLLETIALFYYENYYRHFRCKYQITLSSF